MWPKPRAGGLRIGNPPAKATKPPSCRNCVRHGNSVPTRKIDASPLQYLRSRHDYGGECTSTRGNAFPFPRPARFVFVPLRVSADVRCSSVLLLSSPVLFLAGTIAAGFPDRDIFFREHIISFDFSYCYGDSDCSSARCLSPVTCSRRVRSERPHEAFRLQHRRSRRRSAISRPSLR